MPTINPFLWFNDNAEEAVDFYATIFDDAKIGAITRYTEGGPGPVGQVMSIEFEMLGQKFAALNGGPVFEFSEAISFVINVDGQEEVDHYWTKLTAAGGEEGQCGWLKDKFGLSWQVVPKQLNEMLGDPDTNKANLALQAMLNMHKIDIAAMQAAYNS